jgi:hypothetical protein
MGRWIIYSEIEMIERERGDFHGLIEKLAPNWYFTTSK